MLKAIKIISDKLYGLISFIALPYAIIVITMMVIAQIAILFS